MDMIFGPSFQPVSARAFTDAYTRAAAADRTARQAARSRMEVTGAAPVRSVRDMLPNHAHHNQTPAQRRPRLAGAARPAPSQAAPARAMRDAWPLSFAAVLAQYRGA